MSYFIEVRNIVEVMYEKLLKDDDGISPLIEEVPLKNVRSYPYKWRCVEFYHGKIVDTWYHDGWWKGNIVKETRNNSVVKFENPD
ncbi:hypothetical protein LXL04_035583 [Taraxacum kok-saghyz]